MSRLAKQLIYGTIYLLILALISWWIYLVFLQPTPSCTNGRKDGGEEGVDCGGVCPQICLPADLKPVDTIGGVNVFRTTPGRAALLAKIRNPNSTLGAGSINYRFEVLGVSGGVLASLGGSTFVYASETKQLVGFVDLKENERIGQVKLVLSDPRWVKTAKFYAPAVSVTDTKTGTTSSTMEVNGRVTNQDSVSVSDVSIVAVFYNQLHLPIGASRTEIESLYPGVEQEFTIIHPVLQTADLQKTEISVYARRPTQL